VSYRDELDAALSRIHALEAELAQAHKDAGLDQLELARQRFEDNAKKLKQASATLSTENATMAQALTDLQNEHQSALHELKELRAKFYGVVPASPRRRGRPTLVDYNRQLPEYSYAERRAGVSCPACAFFEEDVEMVYMGSSSQMSNENFSGVVCPKCGHAGRKRAR
jgi:rubrerythrin